MRLYVKLVLLVAAFLAVARLHDEAAWTWAWQMSFAARCYVADLLQCQTMEDELVAEAQARLRRERAMMDVLAVHVSPGGERAMSVIELESERPGSGWCRSSSDHIAHEEPGYAVHVTLLPWTVAACETPVGP